MKRSELREHRYLVFGAARSGIAAANLLRRHGCDVLLADEKPAEKAGAVAQELDQAGIAAHWGPASDSLLDGRDIVILSPGISVQHPLIQSALKSGRRVISEIELAAALASPESRILAVTGTNGKTTVTSWIAHILKTAGLNAVAGGNIGDAWSNLVDAPQNQKPGTIFAVETSSFQLETIEDFRPDIALLTNLAPDHLDRYAGYEDYVAAKRNILRNMGAQQAFVFNADNPDSRDFARGSAVRTFEFTTRGVPPRSGAGLEGDTIVIHDESSVRHELIDANELPLPGTHNLENALAAAMACHLVGADSRAISEGLKSFRGVEHRIEFCGERAGVRFYNDSKATNIDSLAKALHSFPGGIVLIAGGRDKHSDYGAVADLVRERVKHLVTLGEAAPLIEASWGEIVPARRAASMDEAVALAAGAAHERDVVLLSPACASFDMYSNYEERGRDFKHCVQALIRDS